MKTAKIVIERSKDGTFWAYAENLEGVSGVGNTVAEVKQSVQEGLELQKELGNIPNTKYKLKFDTESLLQYYKGIFTKAGLERLTGINQRQLQHYSAGLKKPRETQRKKIEQALHKLGSELLAVEL